MGLHRVFENPDEICRSVTLESLFLHFLSYRYCLTFADILVLRGLGWGFLLPERPEEFPSFLRSREWTASFLSLAARHTNTASGDAKNGRVTTLEG